MTKGESSVTVTTLSNIHWLSNAKVGDKIVMCRYCKSTITVKKGCYRLYKHAKTLRHKRNEDIAESAREGDIVEYDVEKRNQNNIEEDLRRINEASRKRVNEASSSRKRVKKDGLSKLLEVARESSELVEFEEDVRELELINSIY